MDSERGEEESEGFSLEEELKRTNCSYCVDPEERRRNSAMAPIQKK